MARELPDGVLRAGGIASIAAGVLMVAGFVLHPAGEDATFGTDPWWVPAHALLWAAFTIALLAWTALYAAQASRAGSLGMVAYIVILLGTSLASWIFSSDVTFVPVIAARSPALFKEIYGTAHVWLGILSVLGWVLGNVLFGWSIVRAKVFSPWAGVLLATGPVVLPVVYLTSLPVRAGAVGAAMMAAGQIWLGVALLRALPQGDGRLV